MPFPLLHPSFTIRLSCSLVPTAASCAACPWSLSLPSCPMLPSLPTRPLIRPPLLPFPPLLPPRPACSELSMNALTGTFPAPISTALKRLMEDQNFLAGTFPGNSATYCTAYYNCIAAAAFSTCNAAFPTLSIPTYACQFCGMTNAQGTACMGNPCVPTTPSPITAVNTWNPVPVMRCDPVPIQASQGIPPIHGAAPWFPKDPTHCITQPPLAPSCTTFPLMHDLPPHARLAPSCTILAASPLLAAAALVAMAPGLWMQATCTIAGQAYIPGTLPMLFCNPAGIVLDMYAPCSPRPPARLVLVFFTSLSLRLRHVGCLSFLVCHAVSHSLLTGVNATGVFPADSSKLSALTRL
ncbi:unnamed protein product [Closterium sp. Naga37s-1]|nr:unnamed protein product [Closterium sp. Naga37s-1]